MSNASCYAYGNCTYGVAELLPWIPCGLGNAIDWISNARAKGLPTGLTPKVGAAVVFYGYPAGCTTGCLYASLGHCGVVVAVASGNSFTVKEMNFDGNGGGYNRYDERQSSMLAVLGFIYPPGGAPAPPTTTKTTTTVTTRTKAAALVLLGGVAAVGGLAVYEHPGILGRTSERLAKEERRGIRYVRARL
ncbi:MAG: CHAP domain-containing protein [Candidatus Dormibacteria bacterium]